jgi:hypothetical protein
MVTGLTGLVNINQQILIVDRDFDQISYLQIRQSLVLPHVHGDIPRLALTGIDFGLVASDFLNCAEKNAVLGKQLRICLFYFSKSTCNGYRSDEPYRKYY